jgi:predicted RNA-binding protein with PUA-like domain
MEIVTTAYPDHTAFDPESRYFDAKSDADNPRWMMVDVRYRRKLRHPVSLAALKADPQLAGMRVCQKGSRLSITPVSKEEWEGVLALSESSSVTR